MHDTPKVIPYATAMLVTLAASTIGCKPKAGQSDQKEQSKSSSNVGMFLPESSSSSGLALTGSVKSMGVKAFASALHIKLDDTCCVYNVIHTTDGDQILMAAKGLSYPYPVYAIDHNGGVHHFSAHVRKFGAGAAVLQNYASSPVDQPPQDFRVSADGNVSNGFFVRPVRNGDGRMEPYLITYLNTMNTSDGRRLMKVGNYLIDEGTGEASAQFSEVGNQAWVFIGIYSDKYLTNGSAIWSPDMKTFYTRRSANDPIYEWAQQNRSLMNLVGQADASVAQPAIITEVLAHQPGPDGIKSLAHFGPPFAAAKPGATSVAGTGASWKKTGLGLTDAGPGTAPSSKDRAAFDAFFTRPGKKLGFGLAGGSYAMNGKTAYSTGTPVTFSVGGHTFSGTTAIATSATTTPGGWFTSDTSTKTNYVDIGNGVIAKTVQSNKDAEPTVTFLNQYDIQNQANAANAPSTYKQQQDLTQQFKDQSAAANKSFESSDALAGQFQNNYGTAKGLAANVVLPVAAGAASDKLGGVVGKAIGEEGGGELVAGMIKGQSDAMVDLVQDKVAGKEDADIGKTQATDQATNAFAPIIGDNAAGYSNGALKIVTNVDTNATVHENLTNMADGFGSLVQTAVPIPGTGVATKIAVQGAAALDASSETQAKFAQADATADKINQISNDRNNANALLSYVKKNDATAGTDTGTGASTSDGNGAATGTKVADGTADGGTTDGGTTDSGTTDSGTSGSGSTGDGASGAGTDASADSTSDGDDDDSASASSGSGASDSESSGAELTDPTHVHKHK